MPAPRWGLDDSEVIAYGFMEPVVPPDSGRTWSALSIPCSVCSAGIGDHCPGARFCPDRMTRLRELISSGELAGKPIPPRVKECEDCHKRQNQSKTKWLACSRPEHRCLSKDHGMLCAGAVVPGTNRCPAHSD